MTEPADKTHPPRTGVIWLAALLSGGAALAYEISWSRALVVPLGNATDATALVLAAFMVGIGGGAHLAGRLAERVVYPLRLYALAELVLAAYALAAPHLLTTLSGIPGGTAGEVLRYLAALLLITLPCLAMGASLPLLVRALTTRRATLDLQVGIAYGANTAGAALGAILTGFWGIAHVGVTRWSAWAATASLAAAALAWLVARPQVPVAQQEPAPATPKLRRFRHAALAAAFVSGFVMLANEMLWARLLTFVFGHDTYAFASLLAFVLVGLALGGLTHRLFAKRDQTALLATLLGAFSVASLASFWWAASLIVRGGRDPFDLEASGSFATSLRLELIRELAYTPLLVLLPSVLAGAAFPAACSLFGKGAHDAGRRVGVVALFNGVGAACGALVAALGLISITGIQGAFIALALLASATSAAVFLTQRQPSAPARTWALAAIPVVATIALAAAMPAALPRQMLLSVVGPRHEQLLHYEEARTGTVSVIRNDLNQERQLLMNAVNEVTTRLVHDQSFKVLGHLAPLIHPQPRRGVMICLGAGLSAGAALTHPLERLDVIDLSSAVARGARYFAAENNGVLDDPRLHLHIDDGRQFLLNSSERYEVAIIDSTHPKAVDSWILYTREFYDLVRRHLADDGIVVQWLPLHGMSEREFKIIVRTFLQAFPDMTLWANVGFETYGQVGYAKLVGTREGALRIDYDRVATRLDGTPMGADLAAYGMDGPQDLLDLFVAGPGRVEAWTAGLPVQTDDHPIVPYTTRYSTGRRMVPALLGAVNEDVRTILHGGEQHAARIEAASEAQRLVVAGNLARALELHPTGGKLRLFVEQTRTTEPYYLGLAERYPDDPDRLFEAASQLSSLGHSDEARPLFEKALALRPGDFRARLDFALLLIHQGDTGRAIDLLRGLRDEHPEADIVHHNLAVATLARGEAGAAAAHAESALAWNPGSSAARLTLARARLALGEVSLARDAASKVVDANPWNGDAHRLMGLVEAADGNLERADQHLVRACEVQPFQPGFLFDLGRVRQRRGDHAGALLAFETALRVESNDARVVHAAGVSAAATKDLERATELQLRALELEPDFADAALELGAVLRAQQRIPQAIDAFCLALRLDPTAHLPRKELDALEATCSGPETREAPSP